jgi:enoyl-CoA hydratase/carnithine racemase
LEGYSSIVTDHRRLVVQKSDGVGWIILNRPEAGNSFDAAMLDQLEEAWADLDADPEVRVIVNTANGKSFCTGMDVVQVARDKAAMRKHSRRTRDAELKISSWHCAVWKPVIAAVNGVCAGGGLHLVADADIVIAAESASFVDPHVSVGQAVAYEAITLLRKSPMEAITRMALSGKGERTSAARAYELGIVSEVVPDAELRNAAASLAAAIATNSPTAMRATKKSLWRSLEVGLTQARSEAAGDGRPTTRPSRGGAMTYQRLIVERRGPVGWIVNNRPDRLNAYDAVMREEFRRAWAELDADPEVRVIVHTGNGRAFQVGADVEELDGQAVQQFQDTMASLDLGLTGWHCNVGKPVITAVNGVCAGGGLHWVADADIVIAASDATFVDPHVSIGQVSALETIALMRKMPAEAVLRMALVGSHERLTAQRAYQLGMISQVVDPPENLREVAQDLAEKIAKNSPAAMRATKRALWGALEHGLTDACREGATHLTSMWGHPDQNEGPMAFAEKRTPQWQPLERDS